jgi:hypothetical protein
MDHGNRLYVDIFQTAVAGGECPGVIGGRVPPHLFGQLAKLPEGRAAVTPLLPALIERLEKRSETEKLAALFALGHFGSEKATHAELANVKAVEAMMQLWASASYSFKGTIIASLSMFPDSKYVSTALEANNWQIFRFGRHTAVFPCDLSVPESETHAMTIPAGCVDVGDSGIKALVAQLSSPISVKSAQATLMKMFNENQEPFTQTALASWAHEFMAKYFVPSEVRLFLIRLFGKAPLVQSAAKPAVDQKELARARAQIFEYLKKQSMDAFTAIPIPVLKAADLQEGKVCAAAPEVYLSDDEFKAVAKVAKDAFYALAQDKMDEIRRKLLSH